MVENQIKIMSKVIYITGGTKGIGFGIAEVLLKNGHKVAISGRKQEDVDKAVSELKNISENVFGVSSDVRNFEDEENAIYRVIQESVTNAIRHGKASNVWISIEKDGPKLLLTIQDDGIGCQEMKKGFGTRHITERIEMLNGTVQFDGSNGFAVHVQIPIRWGEEYD